MKLKINKDLKVLIPPLKDDEYNLLEQSIINEGCRDSLITWDDTIVDGHNRYEICTKNGIPFGVEDRDFENIEAVKVWMIDNQKGRRNLTDGWKFELAQTRKEILAEKAKENQSLSDGRGKKGLSIVDKGFEPINTRDEIAKDLGWSTGKVAMADKVWKEATPEVKEKVKAGETSINQAYKEIKKEQKKEKRLAEIEEVKKKIENEPIEIGNEKYDVIAIDPPWAYGRAYDPETSRVANPYPEMETKEIAKIDLPEKSDIVLFLWTTHAFIQDAFYLLKEWGYTYKATLVWDKEKMGMGSTVRMQCEFCLLAVKGKPIIQGSSERDIIRESRRQHSRKPESFYEMVDRMCIGRKLDYFSREKREGWDVFGAETEKF